MQFWEKSLTVPKQYVSILCSWLIRPLSELIAASLDSQNQQVKKPNSIIPRYGPDTIILYKGVGKTIALHENQFKGREERKPQRFPHTAPFHKGRMKYDSGVAQ